MAFVEQVHIYGPKGPRVSERIDLDGAAHANAISPGSGPTDRDGNSSQMGLATDT